MPGYTVSQALEVLRTGDPMARADIARHYPLFATTVHDPDAILKALDFVGLRRVEQRLRATAGGPAVPTAMKPHPLKGRPRPDMQHGVGGKFLPKGQADAAVQEEMERDHAVKPKTRLPAKAQAIVEEPAKPKRAKKSDDAPLKAQDAPPEPKAKADHEIDDLDSLFEDE